MDSLRPPDAGPSSEAADFVRYCYRRRRTGWPEIYDEMCAVASRRLYKGWGFAELSEHGIGFSLFETPALAALVSRVISEEGPRRGQASGVPTLMSRPAEPKIEPAEPAAEAPAILLSASAAAG
jgi:hypothetical protein